MQTPQASRKVVSRFGADCLRAVRETGNRVFQNAGILVRLKVAEIRFRPIENSVEIGTSRE
jgi:hypothetical protein